MPDPLHPHYDEPGVTYDSGFFYADEVQPLPTPQPKPRTRMSSIVINLSRLNAKQVIDLSDLVSPKLAPPAPATPPLPNMAAKVTALVTKRDAAKAASDTYEAAKAALVNLKSARDSTADALRAEHKVVISAVEAEARGDATALSSSGYPLGSSTPQSATLPGVIGNVSLTAGDADATLDLSYDPEPNSKTYEVQLSTVDPLAGPWNTHVMPTTSSLTLTGLTSGQRVWVRVRGVGVKGTGGWSDPATKIVP